MVGPGNPRYYRTRYGGLRYGGSRYGGPEGPGYGGFGGQGYPAPSPFRPPEYPPPPNFDFDDSSPPQDPSPLFPPPNLSDSDNPRSGGDLFGWIRNLLDRIFNSLKNIPYDRPRIGGRVIIGGPGYIAYLPFGLAHGPMHPGFAPPFFGPDPVNDMDFSEQPEWPSEGYSGSETPPPQISPELEPGNSSETSPVEA
uniref:Uncharacterized protein isoform X2 n=1 Tax=Pogona vitticeps TaxID=103695 RepID=A0ABM5ES06_9SAUR